MADTTLISGITGQDGVHLADFLLKKDYKVYGTYRRLSTPNFWRLQYLDIFDKVNLIPADLQDLSSLIETIKISDPDEFYNLAAQSFIDVSFNQLIATEEINGIGIVKILEAIRIFKPVKKMYRASTNELFGKDSTIPQSEKTAFQPSSPYAAAKLYGYWMTNIYREGYEVFTCISFLFNHESLLRGFEFVIRKISNNEAKIVLGNDKDMTLGNIEAKREWGYSLDYVESMLLMSQQDEPEDYVIATNESHSVKEFFGKAFEIDNLNWWEYVNTDKRFCRPIDVEFLQGDYSKAKEKLGWKPKVTFNELVNIMVKEDLARWEKWQNSERSPWDAFTYPDEPFK